MDILSEDMDLVLEFGVESFELIQLSIDLCEMVSGGLLHSRLFKF